MKYLIFDPRVIFCGVWLPLLVSQVIDSSFYSFEIDTWVVMACALIAFICGAEIGIGLPYRISCPDKRMTYSDNFIRKTLTLFFVLYAAVLSVVVTMLYDLLGGSDVLMGPASNLRLIIINDFLGERLIFGYLRVFYFGVGLSLFALSFSSRLGGYYVFFIILIGLLSALATTGRLYILLFVIASSALLYRQKIISSLGLLAGGVGFIFLFFSLAFILDKGDTGSSVFDSVAWNSKIYFMSSLACFNDYVRTGSQEIQGGALLPEFIRPLLNNIGFIAGKKPELLPFSYVPEPCNTYTVLFPYYHDFGFVGVSVFMFIAGIAHQYLHKIYRVSESPIKWYLFSISLYPLVMMVFEEAYMSSIGFWFMLLVLPVFFWIIHKVVNVNYKCL